MKEEYGKLFVSIMLIIISAFPLFDILFNISKTINISAFSLAIIVIMLIVILFSSIIYFISYWTERFNQLHFKGTVYTVPEIYQVKGLHNSSSLYKITIAQRGLSRFGDRYQNAGGGDKPKSWLISIYAIWTCSSVGQSNRLIIWRSQVQTLAGPQQMIP